MNEVVYQYRIVVTSNPPDYDYSYLYERVYAEPGHAKAAVTHALRRRSDPFLYEIEEKAFRLESTKTVYSNR